VGEKGERKVGSRRWREERKEGGRAEQEEEEIYERVRKGRGSGEGRREGRVGEGGGK